MILCPKNYYKKYLIQTQECKIQNNLVTLVTTIPSESKVGAYSPYCMSEEDMCLLLIRSVHYLPFIALVYGVSHVHPEFTKVGIGWLKPCYPVTAFARNRKVHVYCVKIQWCASGLIISGFISTKFDECGSASRSIKSPNDFNTSFKIREKIYF